jgi:hypothetical protein
MNLPPEFLEDLATPLIPPPPDLSVEPPDLMDPPDLGPPDLYGMCPPPQTGKVCMNPVLPKAGCLAAESCGPSGGGNGLDDNCDGKVDEGCSCTPGAVQKCFPGSPGKRNIGACTDGTQTCVGAEFGTWGPCVNAIVPGGEACDKLDNDCNGCADDGLCCAGQLDCPGPNDPRIPPQQPYTTFTVSGAQFYPDPGATNWRWTVTGGPCDVLFTTTTGTTPKQSYTITGANTANPSFNFTLSGSYTITFTVTGGDGKTYTCTWVQIIQGPGVRFELCWDHSGSADIDLHVHMPDSRTPWFENPVGTLSQDDCYYRNCKASNYPTGTPMWGYTPSNISACIGSPSGTTWQTKLNACHNPRLDIDNIASVGVPENTNIDRPKNHETFRAMAHYFSGSIEIHPMVNIYCGGQLKATYGQAPNTLGPCPGPSCFNSGQGLNKGLMWRVADVEALSNAMGDTVDCNVTAVHPPGTTSGYYVTNNDSSF